VNQASRGWSGLEWRGALAGALLVACLAAVGSTAKAQDGPTIRSIAVGLGGWVKAGKWAPVRVEVDGGDSSGSLRLVLTTSDPSERTAAFESPAVELMAGRRTRLVGWFQPGRLGGDLGVSIESDGVSVDRRTIAMSSVPRRPFNWRMRVGGAVVSRGVDRIEIPVHAGQTVVFLNGDPHAAHGLVVPAGPADSGGPVEGLRETSGSAGGLVDPLGESATSSGAALPVVARFEVTGELSESVAFHGLSTGWALSGRFIPGDAKRSDTAAGSSVIEVVFEGSPVVLSQSETLWISWGGAAGMDVSGPERSGDLLVESDRRTVAWSGSSRRIERVIDLDAIDAIVMAAGDEYAIDESDSLVLSEWVAAGGQLVLSVGSRRASWLRSPLASWVPITAQGDRQVSDSDLRGLETLATAGGRIPFQGRVSGTLLGLRDGRTSAASLSGPLVGEAAWGFGRVTMLAVDIDRQPLARWGDLPRLVERLVEGSGLDEPLAAADGSRSNLRTGGALSFSGISDLKTQLHGVQDEFQEVNRPGIWQVFFLVIVVLLLVGPVDYVVVRHLLKRPRATWVTLPLIIVITTGLAVWSGTSVRGPEVLVNQLDIVDLDTLEGHIGGRSWATIYSGQSQRLRVEARPPAWLGGEQGSGDTDCRLGWSGVPEVTFGGMHRDGRSLVEEPDYRVRTGSMETSIDDLPVAVSSTRTLSAAWQVKRKNELVSVSLQSSGVGQLTGELSHKLPGSIDDWLIGFGSRVYMPRSSEGRSGSWASGTTLELEGADVRNESLKRYLTRTTTRRVARLQGDGSDVLNVAGQYAPLNRDPFDWFETLTFHRAAGGSGFTGLENRDLAALDLSQLIQLDRAVLIGRLVISADEHQAGSGSGSGRGSGGTELLIEGPGVKSSGSRRVTFIRMVLRVVSRRPRPNQSFVDPDKAPAK
jgi:hypothetical protein